MLVRLQSRAPSKSPTPRIRTLLALCALAACAQPVAEPQSSRVGNADRGPILRGHAVIGHEVRSFQPCAETRSLWLVPTPELRDAVAALAPEPYAPVYVELRGDLAPAPATGFGAESDAQLSVRELLRAAPVAESHGCDEDLRGVAFRAAGNEPFWNLAIADDRLRLRRLGAANRSFRAGPAQPISRGWRYAAVANGSASSPLVLDLERAACSDSMVGTRYSWRARFEVDGRSYSGCAWEGEAAP